MSRVTKIITKKIKLGPDDGDGFDLNGMFNQMIGPNNINMEIAWVRYQKIKELVTKVINILRLFAETKFMKACNANYYPEFSHSRNELLSFIGTSEQEIKEMFWFNYDSLTLGHDPKKGVFTMKQVNLGVKEKFNEVYNTIIKSNLIRSLVLTCDNLALHKDHIAPDLKGRGSSEGRNDTENKKPSYSFAINASGVTFNPFPFAPSLNLKTLFCADDITNAAKDYVLLVLNRVLIYTYDLYREVSSPNIDVESFTEFIKINVRKMRKIPELHRCKAAFDKIEASIGMFKDNFNDYYKDFVATKSSSIMFEHFITDVSKQDGLSPEALRQFQHIITFYRKMAQQRGANDPRIQALFSQLNNNFEGFMDMKNI